MKLKIIFLCIFSFMKICYGYQDNTQANTAPHNDDENNNNNNMIQNNNQVCAPNEVKMEDCNRCRCAANGIGWFCTRKACPPTPQQRKKREDSFSCTPNQSYMNDCNTCTCNEFGTNAICTAMACLPKQLHKRETAPTPANLPEFKCTPGESFMDDCNSCFCLESGTVAMCTQKGCPPKELKTRSVRSSVPVNNPGFKCTPGEIFMDDCNRCACMESGTMAMCTQMGCPPKELKTRSVRSSVPVNSPGFKCTPGESFMDDCNRCTCMKSGDLAMCTLKACPPKQLHKRSVDPAVPVNSPGFKCTPGESFKDDCNTCFCMESGTMAGCTMMACPPKELHKRSVDPAVPVNSPGFKCTPGESFKDDCNTCTCLDSGTLAACTYKRCLPKSQHKRSLPTEITTKCQPGTTFQKECNTCFCSDTGIPFCTLKGCHGPVRNVRNSVPVVTKDEYKSSDFTCKPGESFKVECNTCQCATDGKSALWCTKIGCLPFNKPQVSTN